MGFVIFVLVFSALAFGPSAAKHEISGRIFNGQDAVKGQFKYMAVVITRQYTPGDLPKRQTCGGTLIGPNWVLTAAHCVDGIEKASIYLGVLDRNQAEINYVVIKNDIILHPEWKSDESQNDIALMRIPTTQECENIAFVQMPFRWIETPADTFTGLIAVAIGFGQKGDNGPPSNRLQWTTMPIITNEECKKFYPDIIERDLCVSTMAPFGSTCMGDSGSALVLANTGQLIGISVGVPLNSTEIGHPVIFTRVISYLPWITEVTGITDQEIEFLENIPFPVIPIS